MARIPDVRGLAAPGRCVGGANEHELRWTRMWRFGQRVSDVLDDMVLNKEYTTYYVRK